MICLNEKEMSNVLLVPLTMKFELQTTYCNFAATFREVEQSGHSLSKELRLHYLSSTELHGTIKNYLKPWTLDKEENLVWQQC